MIQRVQSIYLILAAILCVAAIFAPIPYVISGIQPDAFVDALQFRFGQAKQLHILQQIPLVAINGVIAAICLINIFLFRNRKLQMRICNLTTFLVLVLIGVAVYFALSDKFTPDFPFYGALFPLFVLLANWLAKRGIRHDEKLVSDADRLR